MKGRIQWETAFFGLLAPVGLAASLVAMLLGGLFAVGATEAGETATRPGRSCGGRGLAVECPGRPGGRGDEAEQRKVGTPA